MRISRKKIFDFTNDLINVLTDYAFSLDTYFRNDKNKKEHEALYEEYLILNENIKKINNKYGGLN